MSINFYDFRKIVEENFENIEFDYEIESNTFSMTTVANVEVISENDFFLGFYSSYQGHSFIIYNFGEVIESDTLSELLNQFNLETMYKAFVENIEGIPHLVIKVESFSAKDANQLYEVFEYLMYSFLEEDNLNYLIPLIAHVK